VRREADVEVRGDGARVGEGDHLRVRAANPRVAEIDRLRDAGRSDEGADGEPGAASVEDRDEVRLELAQLSGGEGAVPPGVKPTCVGVTVKRSVPLSRSMRIRRVATPRLVMGRGRWWTRCGSTAPKSSEGMVTLEGWGDGAQVARRRQRRARRACTRATVAERSHPHPDPAAPVRRRPRGL
jgi:hypothetical protein